MINRICDKCGEPGLIDGCCHDHAVVCRICNIEPAHFETKICTTCQKEMDTMKNDELMSVEEATLTDYLITGSRAYGPANKNSDLDIVMGAEDVAKLSDFLIDHDIGISQTPSQLSYGSVGGFYFNLGGMAVNIIIAQFQSDMDDWKRRTAGMKTLPPIADRDKRLNMFNSF